MSSDNRKEDILNPDYWNRRLELAPPANPHHSIFRCPLDVWQRIERKHKEILARTIGPDDSVLDVGCGWGRLLTLMPERWNGGYMGVDISPDFIRLANERHAGRYFVAGDIRKILGFTGGVYDWGVLISFRPMVRRNLGDAVWDEMRNELRWVCQKLLFLEYDETDNGSSE